MRVGEDRVEATGTDFSAPCSMHLGKATAADSFGAVMPRTPHGPDRQSRARDAGLKDRSLRIEVFVRKARSSATARSTSAFRASDADGHGPVGHEITEPWQSQALATAKEQLFGLFYFLLFECRFR